jgi:nitroimidazol reductase NimA-like FMN-containing flavoprotein (pyridoxamine 5'-phosphate oxidase superfamily)
MDREMRRKDRALSEDQMLRILADGHYGVLSTVGETGMPYGVPLSYAYKDGKVYFHAATTGHKLENIQFNSNVSFCVVTDVETVPDKFTTKYKSVIIFGTVTEVQEDKKAEIFQLIVDKFSSDFAELGAEYILKGGSKAKVFQIDVNRATAKGNV